MGPRGEHHRVEMNVAEHGVLAQIAGNSPFSITPPLDSNVGNFATNTLVHVIDASLLPNNATKIRVTFKASSTEGWDLWGASVSHQKPTGDVYDSDADIIQLKFSGSIDPGTIPLGQQLASDLMDFSLDSSRNLIIAHYTDNSGSLDGIRKLTSFTGVTAYLKGGNGVMTQDRTAYAAHANNVVGLSLIEFQ